MNAMKNLCDSSLRLARVESFTTESLCLQALRLQIWNVERLHDQQHPFAHMETPLTTTDSHKFVDGIHHTSWLPEGSGPCSMRYTAVLG